MGACNKSVSKQNDDYSSYKNIYQQNNIMNGQKQHIQPYQVNYIPQNDYPKKEYDYNYYKEYYRGQNTMNQYQAGALPQQNVKYMNTNNQIGIQLNNNIAKLFSNNIALSERFKQIKKQNKFYFKDIKNQEEYISNYKTFINELYYQLNNLYDQLNISVYGQKYEENLINKRETSQLLNELDQISNKINQLNSIIEAQNNEIKNIEIDYKLIQEKFHEIKLNYNSDDNTKQKILLVNNDIIYNELNELMQISNNLPRNKSFYDAKKNEIENDIKRVQYITEQKLNQIKIKRKNSIKSIKAVNNNRQINEMNDDPIFTKGSMLLGIKDFGKAKDIFKSVYLFQQEEEENYETPELMKKNWSEVCYIFDNFDIHDVNYELKAFGLPEKTFFSTSSFGFVLDTDIKILEFEVDGKKTEYDNIEKYCLSFKIHLKNLESNRVYIKYQVSPLLNKLTEGEIKEMNISRCKYYGLSKRLVGQNAKFVLKNQSNFEIINFENEFFIKTNENEYTWGGKVPEGGKSTIVRLSRKQARYNFLEKHYLETYNNLPITNTILRVPFCYKNGNNQTTKFTYMSKQTNLIKLDPNTRTYDVQFLNIPKNKGSFIIKGEIINRCKGEWVVDLTDQQIEGLIPKDFIQNKQIFNQIARTIIKDYDSEHYNDIIKVPDVVKIGKWVKNNIKYDINYSGRNDLTATDIYNIKEGVCDHFTKLFNALVYSLGYQVIYVLGYAIDRNDSFGKEDAHAWSLVKIDGKWLPFDSTWGIFSGKLPVTHIFKQFDCKGIMSKGFDQVKIGKIKIKGNFLG